MLSLISRFLILCSSIILIFNVSLLPVLSPAGAQRSDIPPRKEQHSDSQREECLELDLVNEVTTSPSARPLTN